MTDSDRARDTWTCLAPGVYDDNAGGLHLVMSELLEAHGYADNERNRETLIATAREMLAGAGTPLSVEE